MQETEVRFDPWVRKVSWRREWQPTSVFLPGKSHGQRSLVIYIHGHKESDTTEQLHSLILTQGSQVVPAVKKLLADARDTSSIPESGGSPAGGNGNTARYSYLGNPMDGGAWRATIHGVAESQI